jgi:uncharacterized protein (TIGR02001 family)
MEKIMKLKSKLLLALLAASVASFASAEEAADPLAFNVGVVSQYRYRGIAQSHGDPALQGGVDYTHASGFYVGSWASTISWIDDASNGTAGKPGRVTGPIELDLYAGYKFEAAGIAYDLGYLRYEYVGNTYKNAASANVNASTDEVYGAATYGVATLKYSYALSDLFGYGDTRGSTYWDLSATFDLGNGYSFVPHVGRQSITDGKNSNAGYSYSDFALTINKDLGDGLSASVAAIATTGDKDKYQSNSASSFNAAQNAVVVGVKYTF